YLASDQAFAALPPRASGSLPVRRIRAQIQVRLGDLSFRLGRPDEAEKHFRAALAERETLLKLTPKPPPIVAVLKADIALGHTDFGDFLLTGRKDRTAAAAEYATALDLLSGLLKDEPDNLELQRGVAAAQYRIGVTATDPDRRKAAFAACLRLRDGLAKIDPE